MINPMKARNAIPPSTGTSARDHVDFNLTGRCAAPFDTRTVCRCCGVTSVSDTTDVTRGRFGGSAQLSPMVLAS